MGGEGGGEELLHSGVLELKVSSKWEANEFNVFRGRLVWESDGGQAGGEIALDESTELHILKFGLKKYQFELESAGRTLKLAASGDAERLDWMQALESAALKDRDSKPPASAASKTSSKRASKKSAKGPVAAFSANRVKVSSMRAASFVEAERKTKEDQTGSADDGGLESIIGSIEQRPSLSAKPSAVGQANGDATSGGGGGGAAKAGSAAGSAAAAPASPLPAADTAPASATEAGVSAAAAEASLSAAERIQNKLQGNVSFVATSMPQCAVCSKKVYSIEQVVVDGKKMHKACFRCVECDTKLSPTNSSALNGLYYCRKHYLGQLRAERKKSSPAGALAAVAASATKATAPGASPVAKARASSKSILTRLSRRISRAAPAPASEDTDAGESQDPEQAGASASAPDDEPAQPETSAAEPEAVQDDGASDAESDGAATVDAAVASEPSGPSTPAWKKELDAAKAAKAAQKDAVQEIGSASPKPNRRSVPKVKRLTPTRMSMQVFGFGQPPANLIKRPPPEEQDDERAVEDSESEESESDSDDNGAEAEEVTAPMAAKPKQVTTNKRAAPVLYKETSAEGSAPLTHAVLARPVLRGRQRRAGGAKDPVVVKPTKDPQAKLLHAFTFKFDDGRGGLRTMHCSSLSERDVWTSRISNAIHVKELEAKLHRAQRIDMMSALQAQAELENFKKTADLEYEGYLEILSGKGKKPKWERHFLELKNGTLAATLEKKKKKKPVLVMLSVDCAVLDIQHKIIKAQV